MLVPMLQGASHWPSDPQDVPALMALFPNSAVWPVESFMFEYNLLMDMYDQNWDALAGDLLSLFDYCGGTTDCSHVWGDGNPGSGNTDQRCLDWPGDGI